ncbi:MAG: dUTP diphosphatase [Alphaproteobacteria bacterium]|nr:dUTP diphosphatase [Alphaproteobacteria bacterium]
MGQSGVKVEILRLPHARDLPLPAYATAGSAGIDLLAAIQGDLELQHGKRVAVATGIAIAMPAGYEAQVRPRSGLALHQGITLLNSPGTIDSDYRGEIKVILVNLGEAPFRITRGMKIAQMVIARHEHVEFIEAQNLRATTRSAGGFGSTGT